MAKAEKSEKKTDAAPAAAPDPEIERVADALALPSEDAEPAPVPTRKKKAAATHVVTEWCGQLNHDGRKYLAGEGINLTDEEAAALGKHVEPAS